MRIINTNIDVKHPRAPTIGIVAELDDGTEARLVLHSDEIHSCLEPTLDGNGDPVEVDTLGRPAHFTSQPILSGILAAAQARVAEAQSPAKVADRVALADEAMRKAAAASEGEKAAVARAELASAVEATATAVAAAKQTQIAALDLEIVVLEQTKKALAAELDAKRAEIAAIKPL